MHAIICDRCGANCGKFYWMINRQYSQNLLEIDGSELHLCDECHDEFKEFLIEGKERKDECGAKGN